MFSSEAPVDVLYKGPDPASSLLTSPSATIINLFQNAQNYHQNCELLVLCDLWLDSVFFYTNIYAYISLVLNLKKSKFKA